MVVVGPGVVLQLFRVVGHSRVKAVVEVDLSILEVVVLSILAVGLAFEAEVHRSPHASVVDQVGHRGMVPYCQNRAYQGGVAIHHPLPPVEVCEYGPEL